MRKTLQYALMLVFLWPIASPVVAFGDVASEFSKLAAQAIAGYTGLNLAGIAALNPLPGRFMIWTDSKSKCQDYPPGDMLTPEMLTASFVHLATVINTSKNISVQAIHEKTVALQASQTMAGKSAANQESVLESEATFRRNKHQGLRRLLDIVNVCAGNAGKAYDKALDDMSYTNAAMAADDRNMGFGVSPSSAESWKLLADMAQILNHDKNFTFFPSSGTLMDIDVEEMTYARNILLSSLKNPRPNLDWKTPIEASQYLNAESKAALSRMIIGESLRQWQISRTPLIDFGSIQTWLGAFKSAPSFKTTVPDKSQVSDNSNESKGEASSGEDTKTVVLEPVNGVTQNSAGTKQDTSNGSQNGGNPTKQAPSFNSPKKTDCKVVAPQPGVPNPNLIARLRSGNAFPGIEQMCERAAAQYNINPDFFKAMIGQESSGQNLEPESFPPGTEAAMGPGQMMLSTARWLKCANTIEELKDVQTNLNCSAKFLRKMLDDHNQNYLEALVSYNAGSGTLACYKKNGIEWPYKPMPCRKGVWKWAGYKWAHCHTLAIFGVPIENVLDGTQFELPSASDSTKLDLTYVRTPDQPMTEAELKRITETEATLGIGDKISVTTFLDFVGQRAISQDYLARIASIGNEPDETDDENDESMGSLYGELLRLLSWRYWLMMDMRKAGETNGLLKALYLLNNYENLNKKVDSIIK